MTVRFSDRVGSAPITGRLFVMISRVNTPEVRLQSTWFNSPEMLAVDVTRLHPGEPVMIGKSVEGTPLRSLSDLPAGDYYVQAVFSVYKEFHRADGRVVWARRDPWEGQQFNTAPGNLFSQVKRLHITPGEPSELALDLTETLPDLRAPSDTAWLHYVKIQSKLLTAFWGEPIYLGAVVLLPRDYASRVNEHYPVIYSARGHFNLRAPFDFQEVVVAVADQASAEFSRAWRAGQLPRVVAVSLLDPTPFSDWSGGVNSANNGPYADAIMTELIPYLEDQFHINRDPAARVLVGTASGGREALALQLLHPSFFGGAWVYNPWSFDFRHYFSLDIYTCENAYELSPREIPGWANNASRWSSIERPLVRLVDGAPVASFRDLSRHDAVVSSTAGGDPIGADDAILGPVGDDGYPRKLWDRATGRVDQQVASYWQEHNDLSYYVERNWPIVGPDLVGKLHLYVGEMDHFYRNAGVHHFEEVLRAQTHPAFIGTFKYAPLIGDYQPQSNIELVKEMVEHIARQRQAEKLSRSHHVANARP